MTAGLAIGAAIAGLAWVLTLAAERRRDRAVIEAMLRGDPRWRRRD